MKSAPKEKNSGGGMFSRLFGGIGNMFGGAKSSEPDAGLDDLSDAPDEQQKEITLFINEKHSH